MLVNIFYKFFAGHADQECFSAHPTDNTHQKTTHNKYRYQIYFLSEIQDKNLYRFIFLVQKLYVSARQPAYTRSSCRSIPSSRNMVSEPFKLSGHFWYPLDWKMANRFIISELIFRPLFDNSTSFRPYISFPTIRILISSPSGAKCCNVLFAR